MRKRLAPKHQRLVILLLCAILGTAGVTLILRHFSDNLVYFYAPGDLREKPIASGQRIRLGGLVKSGSLEKNASDPPIRFVITDTVREIPVEYSGVLPNLFREGQGVVAEGAMNAKGVFEARIILAKHDERYMPPEVADALKRSGRWKAQ